MAEHGNNFADRLLHQQSMTPNLQERYRKELKEMFEIRVTGGARAMSYAVVSFRLILGLFCLYLFVYNPWESSTTFRMIYGVGSAMLLSVSGLGAYTIWKGSFNYRSHGNYAANLIFYGSLAIAMVWLLGSGFNIGIPSSVAWTAAPVIIVLLGITKLILNWIKQSEINTREQMLNLEYKLSELAEKLDRPGK